MVYIDTWEVCLWLQLHCDPHSSCFPKSVRSKMIGIWVHSSGSAVIARENSFSRFSIFWAVWCHVTFVFQISVLCVYVYVSAAIQSYSDPGQTYQDCIWSPWRPYRFCITGAVWARAASPRDKLPDPVRGITNVYQYNKVIYFYLMMIKTHYFAKIQFSARMYVNFTLTLLP